MGSSSSSSYVSGSVADKPQLQSAVGAVPLLSNQGQAMATKSSNLFMPSPELSMPYNQWVFFALSTAELSWTIVCVRYKKLIWKTFIPIGTEMTSVE